MATESRGIVGTLGERKARTKQRMIEMPLLNHKGPPIPPELRKLEAAFWQDVWINMEWEDHFHEPKLDIIRLGEP